MSAASRLSAVSAGFCLLFAGLAASAATITLDVPELTGTFTHGQAPISATADFGETSDQLVSLGIEITATGLPGFSSTQGVVPAEIVVSATEGGAMLISPTVLSPFDLTSITLEVWNAWGTLDGDLDGTLISRFEIVVTIDTNDIYSDIVTAPVIEITSVTVTAGFETIPDCGWFGCDGFVGIEELNLVLANWNATVTPPGDFLQGDISGDGFVGIEDLNIVLGNWNTGTPPPGNAVPEPAAIALLGAGLIALMRRS